MDNSLSSASSFNNRLGHAQSTPAGVDGSGMSGSKTPPVTPKRAGKLLAIRVQMLDDTITVFHVQAKAIARLLFDQVCKQLNLLEADYFGLEYQDATTKYWLDFEKPLHRQVGLPLVDALLKFCVKFYTPDPAQLEEEYTRYLFCLQIKKDLMQGDLQCNDNTAALVISYIVQAECGDYAPEDYPDHTYLSSHKFVPHQDRELERKIMENYKKHVGQSPAEADLNLLETARRCELYGMKMHAAKDQESVPLSLAVAHMGIVVFQNCTKINTFSWAKIRKISFKRKRFLIKLHAEGYGYYKDVVEFLFDNRNQCKSFWKKCVENHGFFRCTYVKRIPRQKARVLSRGSSFRYSGKTQKQMVEYVRENFVKRQTFQRSQSFRYQNSTHSSLVNVEAGVSAHPLLPLGETTIAESGASLSCGSMTLSGSLSPTTAQDVGLQTAPTAMTQQPPTTPQQQPELLQSSADVHDPTTTSSDITSIASQSPLHDTVDGNGRTENNVQQQTTEIKKNNTYASNSGIVNGNQIVVEVVETNIPVYKTNGLLPNSYATKFLSKDEVSIESPMPELRNMSRTSNVDEINTDTKKKRPSDKAYFIAKELLVTERTYRKDLEVISFWLRDEFTKEEDDMRNNFEAIDHLLTLIDPIYDTHCVLLREIEIRLSNWEPPYVGDIMINFFESIHLYDRYLEEHLPVLEEINALFGSNPKFEMLYRDFESQKICYLPLTAFILKPLQRLLHYSQILDRLLKYYGKNHACYEDCYQAKMVLLNTAKHVPKVLRKSENVAILYELSRDITGVENIFVPERDFVRQGCLSKFSQRIGYQQRMFFLFSDLLIYSGRFGHTFRVHGQLPLSNVMIEERPDTPQQHSFSIYGGNRVVTVAASSQEEKDKWMEDLTSAIQKCKMIKNHINGGGENNSLHYFSLKSCNSSDDITEKYDDVNTKTLSVVNQRSNNTVYVCWHRNTSICFDDHLRAVENQLSGFLLRKYKNSNGWQKLWVVFTNFCLFFYKSFQEDCPLASLPLLGYTVSTPSEKDAIQKDFVFKLQFKNHIYFFRAESEYTFHRWMEVIGNATQHSGRHRLFSRKESAQLEFNPLP